MTHRTLVFTGGPLLRTLQLEVADWPQEVLLVHTGCACKWCRGVGGEVVEHLYWRAYGDMYEYRGGRPPQGSPGVIPGGTWDPRAEHLKGKVTDCDGRDICISWVSTFGWHTLTPQKT